MITFAAYATNFEIYPSEGAASDHLSPLVDDIDRLQFTLRVADGAVNQGQMDSDFDARLEDAFTARGSKRFHLKIPAGVPQKVDFAFSYRGKSIAVEVEKANREKILRDILKGHMYLHCGADFAVIVLPRNYPHKLGIWNLFDFGVQRLSECRTYGFGTPDRLDRIAMLGFTQHELATDELLSVHTRERMRLVSSVARKKH